MDVTGIGRVGLLITVVLLSACGGGGSSGGGGGPAEDEGRRSSFIRGRVIDGNTGIAVENALIRTDPPTEVRLTDRDGFYLLRNGVLPGESFDVTVRQVGYTPVTQPISVSADGVSGADFSIITSVNGLVSSVSTLQIPRDTGTATFLLSSTLDDTPFSVQTTDPRFIASPATGTLDRNSHLVMEVRLTPTEGPIGRVTGQLVANAENGGTGVTVNLAGNVTSVEQDGEEESDPFGVLVTDDGDLVAGEADISGSGDSFVPDLVNTPIVPRPSTDPECGGDTTSQTVDRVIAFGDLIADELISPTASRTYCFDARAGDQILVNATRTSGTFFSLLVEIRDRAGTVLDSVSGATPGVLTTSVPANGPYTVRITNPRLREAGSFEFALERTNAPGDARSVEYGEVVQGELEGPADLGVFSFAARAGDMLVVPFTRLSGTFFTLELSLRDPSGELLGSGSGVNGVFSATVLESGLHTLWVRNPRLSEAGNYEFNLDRAN